MSVPQCFKQQMFQLAKLVIFHDMTTINIMKNSEIHHHLALLAQKCHKVG